MNKFIVVVPTIFVKERIEKGQTEITVADILAMNKDRLVLHSPEQESLIKNITSDDKSLVLITVENEADVHVHVHPLHLDEYRLAGTAQIDKVLGTGELKLDDKMFVPRPLDQLKQVYTVSGTYHILTRGESSSNHSIRYNDIYSNYTDSYRNLCIDTQSIFTNAARLYEKGGKGQGPVIVTTFKSDNILAHKENIDTMEYSNFFVIPKPEDIVQVEDFESLVNRLK